MTRNGLVQPLSEKSHGFYMALAVLACMALPLIIYSNSLHAPFIFDDYSKIIMNPDIKSLPNIWKKLIFSYDRHASFTPNRNDPSRPVTYLTFALNYHWGGLNIFGYHLFNVVLHCFSTVLMFLLTRKIIFCLYHTHSIIISLFVALFFSSHPINTNVATYIFSRSDALATVFYLSSLLLFIKTFEKNRYFYIFSLLCYVLSLFSKQIAVTLPAVLLIFDYFFLSDFKFSEVIRKKYYHIPFWILTMAFVGFRHLYLGGIGDLEAQETVKGYSYFITQPYIILRYLQMLLVPTGFCLDHYVRPATSVADHRVLASLFIFGITVLAVFIIRKKNLELSKIFLFSTLWFFVTLSPTSSFFPTSSLLVENRMYLPGFGFFLSLVGMYLSVFKVKLSEYSSWNYGRKILIPVLSTHIGFLCILTWKRNQVYQNPMLLWQEAVSRYPDNHQALYNVGLLYDEQKEYNKAMQYYEKAIELDSKSPIGHYNLGNFYSRHKEYYKTIQHYEKAIELNPNFAEAYNNLGTIYYEQKEYSKAMQYYEKAIELDPNFADAHNNLGIIYFEKAEREKALREFEIVLRLRPNERSVQETIKSLRNLSSGDPQR